MMLSRSAVAPSSSIGSSRSPVSRSSRSVARPSHICGATEQQVQTTELATVPKYKNIGPEPRKFSVGGGQLLDVSTAALPLVTRAGAGTFCIGYEANIVQDDNTYSAVQGMGRVLKETSQVGTFPRPGQPLELYEFESCPFCRKVREAIAMLDLDVLMYPCPKDGQVWRPKAIELGGKKQFPYFKDPNTGVAMYESDDIINYLFRTYGGNTPVPQVLRLGPLTTIGAGLGMAARMGKGGQAKPSKQPKEPLVLYGYEGSPFVKLARETLCELELPYLYKNVARGSPRRQEVLDKYGHFQVPLLEDPNEEVYLYESGAIVRYLKHKYAGVHDEETAVPVQDAESSKGDLHKQLFRLKNNKGMDVEISTIGAAITKLCVPDKQGNSADIVLGYQTPGDYLTHEPVTYFGVVVGRVANRLNKAQFKLDGKVYKVLANDGENALHGGALGLHKRVWTATESHTDEASTVTLEYDSPAGEEGYPGHVRFTVVYRVPRDSNELLCEMRALVEEATPINMVQHTYFNLGGHNSGRTILDHVLHMPNADHFTPVGPTLIPTGEIQPVTGTPFDFTSPHTIGERIDTVPNAPPGGYDHNFVLFNQGPQAKLITKNGMASANPKSAVTVHDPKTGRVMEVLTTAPGVQFYSGNYLDGTITGKGKAVYNKYGGLCLETQGFPDSINQPNFPSIVVQPEEPYVHKMLMKFSTK